MRRKGQGIEKLKKLLAQPLKPSAKKVFTIDEEIKPAIDKIKEKLQLTSDYQSYQLLQQKEHFAFLSEDQKQFIVSLSKEFKVFPGKYQGAETILRYGVIQEILNKVIMKSADPEWNKRTPSARQDIYPQGLGLRDIFCGIVYDFSIHFYAAQIPMDFIDGAFAMLSNYLKATPYPKARYLKC